jgi:S-DNA-T family DNA segregation ATPase FtsK/SpoIIIE
VPYLLLPVALWLTDWWRDALALVLAVLLYRPVADLIRFALAPSAARRHYLGMVRARHRWHWLCRCTGLGQPELAAKNRPAAESRALLLVLLAVASRLLALLVGIEVADRLGRIHYPRAKRWRLTEYGWQCMVKTAPRTGRKEVEKQTQHVADYWRSVRVGVTQAAPGRLIVRALREDPLAVPFGPDRCPPGTFEPHAPTVLYVGRDDFGNDRYLPLRGLTGICVSGLPGFGKTSFLNSCLCQLAPTPAAQFGLLDGKDGGDQEPWHDRAWRHAGDQLADALDLLEDTHAEMRRRLRNIVSLCGQRNAWNAGGPTEDLPLLVTILDECQTYLDLAQYKGDRVLESMARRCIALVGELIRKGRSVLCLTILATQKTTGDSIPTSLRDNSGLALSFALKTTESSVAALGDAIREYPGYSPTLLRETPNGIGTAVVTLTTGTDPFTRLRVPLITEQWAAERAAAAACHRREPGATVLAENQPDSVHADSATDLVPVPATRDLERMAD